MKHNRIAYMEALQSFGVKGGPRVEQGAIWDRQTYAAAGQTVLNFFTEAYTAAGKGKDKTNMKRNG